eukprot:jgi/Mesen1/8989/ME000056S08394
MGHRKHADVSSASLLRQLLFLLCENRPGWVASILFKDSSVTRGFFEGSSKRVQLWFQHFAAAGGGEHRFGAQALSKFAFAHREEHWRDLRWTGKHARAPVSVAAKPHYFCELDVVGTVESFLQNVPSFWASDELWRTLEGGGLVALDPAFFVGELLKCLNDVDVDILGDDDSDGGRSRRPGKDRGDDMERRKVLSTGGAGAAEIRENVWDKLKMYLREESFPVLCKRLLYTVHELDLFDFVKEVSREARNGASGDGQEEKHTLRDKGGKQRHRSSCSSSRRRDKHSAAGDEGAREEGGGDTGAKTFRDWEGLLQRNVNDSLLCIACAHHGRQVLKLLTESEHSDELQSFRQALHAYTSKVREAFGGEVAAGDLQVQASSQAGEADGAPDLPGPAGVAEQLGHWQLYRRACEHSAEARGLFLALDSILLRYRLHELSGNASALEAVMRANKIGFEKAGGSKKVGGSTASLHCSSGYGAPKQVHEPPRGRHKRHKRHGKHSRRKKRRKRDDSSCSSENALPGSDDSGNSEAEAVLSGHPPSDGWKLSTDDFRLTWSSEELPDQLADWALARWCSRDP